MASVIGRTNLGRKIKRPGYEASNERPYDLKTWLKF